MTRQNDDETFVLERFKPTRNRAELRRKKMEYWKWLDTPKELRKPVLAKDAEEYLAISHPVFITWGQEYRAQQKLGMRVKAQVNPVDLASVLVEKLQVSQRLLDRPESNDPVDRLRDTAEAAAWLTLGNTLVAVNQKIINCADPETLIRIAEKAAGIVEKTQKLVLERLPLVKQEAQRIQAQDSLGRSLAGIILPGESPRALPVPSPQSPPVQEDSETLEAAIHSESENEESETVGEDSNALEDSLETELVDPEPEELSQQETLKTVVRRPRL